METKRSCHSCTYAVVLRDGRRQLRVCMNGPETPGEIVVVQEGATCRNWRRKWCKPLRLPAPEPANDEVRYIPLTQGKFAIVDAADYERVSQYKWHLSRQGSNLYAHRKPRGHTVPMHRFIMNPPKGMVVDHIDGNGLNNRRCNLRICTQRQNVHNSRPSGEASAYKGVRWDKSRQRWIAAIYDGTRHIHVGRFDDEAEAARAYDRKALELFGEYAYLNFPDLVPRAPQDGPTRISLDC